MTHHKVICLLAAISLFFYSQAQEEYDLVFPGTASVGSNWIYIDQNNDNIFFATSSSADGRELWKSDGTQAGTIMVKDIDTSGSGMPNNPVGIVVGDILYFAGDEGVTSGQELWKSDGTEAGTVLIKDIFPGSNFGFNTEYIVEFEGGVAFNGEDTNGEELWKSDGTEAGTVMVKDINSGSSGSLVRYIANADGTLYFIAADASEFGLWKSDGTDAGTTKLSDLGTDADPEYVTYHQGDILLHNWTTSDPTKNEMWISDGTVSGTMKLTDTNSSGPINDPMVAVGSNLFFRAGDNDVGIELYKTDGTAGGTGLVKDLSPGAGDGFPRNFIEYMGEIYFTSGSDVWKSDGTEAGTTNLITSSSFAPELLTDGVNLYYRTGGNLGIYNPTDGVTEITTTPDFYVNELLTIFNGELYFLGGNDIEAVTELWKYTLPGMMDQTITFDELTPVTFGDVNFDLTATSTSGLAVSFVSSDDAVAAVTGNTVTINGAGTCDITASQAGNDDYNPAPDAVQILLVNQASQTITFDALSPMELDNGSFVLTGTSTSNLEVTYVSSDPSVASVTTDGIVTPEIVGVTTITASQAGDNNYLPAEDVDQLLTIIDPLGIADTDLLRIYPNPFSAEITIEFSGNQPNTAFDLVDASGRNIHTYRGNQSTFTIDMTEFGLGMYYLHERGGNAVYKLIKHR